MGGNVIVKKSVRFFCLVAFIAATAVPAPVLAAREVPISLLPKNYVSHADIIPIAKKQRRLIIFVKGIKHQSYNPSNCAGYAYIGSNSLYQTFWGEVECEVTDPSGDNCFYWSSSYSLTPDINHANGKKAELKTEMERNHFHVVNSLGWTGNFWLNILKEQSSRYRYELREDGPSQSIVGNCYVTGNTAEVSFNLSETNAQNIRIGAEVQCEIVKISGGADQSNAKTKGMEVKIGVNKSNNKDILVPSVERVKKVTIRETLEIDRYGNAKLRTEFMGIEPGWKLVIKSIPKKGGKRTWTEQDDGFPLK